MILALVLGAMLGPPSPAPFSSVAIPWTRPTPAPVVWDGAPGTRFTVTFEPLDPSADGEARVLARVRFRTASGAETHLLGGGDFDYVPTRGRAQWQTRLRYGGPAAIVRLRSLGSFDLRVVANKPAGLATVIAHFDASRIRLPAVVAKAVGPHLIAFGFAPRPGAADRTIQRARGSSGFSTFAHVRGSQATFRDGSVLPNERYTYRIALNGEPPRDLTVQTPPEVPQAGVATVRGTGAWIAFSGSLRDDDRYTRLDPDRIVATARRSGLHYLMLRMTYGEFWQITPDAKRTIDRLIDGAARARIALLAWTVPREASAEDVAASVRALVYRTPAGHGMSGLAVDLERGDEFLGVGKRGFAALASYLGFVRAAVGPQALLVATVEDPYLERLDNRVYPYRAIARSADVIQPMTYWRMLRRSTSVDRMREALAGSYRALRAQAGPERPISIGGQTAALSPSGGPPPVELAASIPSCKRLGAIGVAFYAWSWTTDAQWDAIRRVPW